MVDTLLNIAMMHSDTLVIRAKEGDQSAQGKLVQLWYKRIYNFGYKFFMDHDLAMEVSQRTSWLPPVYFRRDMSFADQVVGLGVPVPEPF